MPKFWTTHFIIILVFEIILGFDILINFFLQGLSESGESMRLPMEKVVKNYRDGRFLFDLIALIPFGALEISNEKLKCLWFFKIIRIRDIIKYLGKTFYQSFINYFVTYFQKRAFDNPDLCESKDIDSNFIEKKMFIQALFKLSSILLQIGLIVFLVGQFWFICVQL